MRVKFYLCRNHTPRIEQSWLCWTSKSWHPLISKGFSKERKLKCFTTSLFSSLKSKTNPANLSILRTIYRLYEHHVYLRFFPLFSKKRFLLFFFYVHPSPFCEHKNMSCPGTCVHTGRTATYSGHVRPVVSDLPFLIRVFRFLSVFLVEYRVIFCCTFLCLMEDQRFEHNMRIDLCNLR